MLMDWMRLTIIDLYNFKYITAYNCGELCCNWPIIGYKAAGLLLIICFIWANCGLFTNWANNAVPIYPLILCCGSFDGSGILPLNKYSTARYALPHAAFNAFLHWSRGKPIDIN